MENVLSGQQVCLIITSMALGALDTAVKQRVKYLGGWDKASIKQGIFDIRDPAVKELQQLESDLFATLNRCTKGLGKLGLQVVREPGQPLAQVEVSEDVNTALYDMAADINNEQERIINEYIRGERKGNITFTDGYHRALLDMRELMFDQRLTRDAALNRCAAAYDPAKDLQDEEVAS